MVVGDGTVGGFFVLVDQQTIAADVMPSTDSKVLILPNKTRRGERSMIAYLEWCIEKEYLVAGDLLLTDNESSFKTEEVQNFLNHHNIENDNFPPYRGSIMNPCDNSFHSTFKKHYYDKILDQTSVSMAEKIRFAREAYFSIDEISIKRMFKRTGLTGGDIHNTVIKLSTEGLHLNQQQKIIHGGQMKAFAKWAAEQDYSFDRESESELLKDDMSSSN
jgi:hypothetical protein